MALFVDSPKIKRGLGLAFGAHFLHDFSISRYQTKYQGLIQKIKVHIESKQTVHYICFFLFLLLLRSHYVADLIKKLEFHLMVSSVLLKNKFRHAKIIALKIGILMSETACINPLMCY